MVRAMVSSHGIRWARGKLTLTHNDITLDGWTLWIGQDSSGAWWSQLRHDSLRVDTTAGPCDSKDAATDTMTRWLKGMVDTLRSPDREKRRARAIHRIKESLTEVLGVCFGLRAAEYELDEIVTTPDFRDYRRHDIHLDDADEWLVVYLARRVAGYNPGFLGGNWEEWLEHPNYLTNDEMEQLRQGIVNVPCSGFTLIEGWVNHPDETDEVRADKMRMRQEVMAAVGRARGTEGEEGNSGDC
jgi:hypothetical protein